ncbi:MAG: DUF4339 domain-containing protein [Polyangiaceae bacterium]
MRWYVSVDGQPTGPYEEEQIVDLVRSGRPDLYIRGEGGGAWLSIQQSPFAGYAPPPPSLNPMYSQAQPAQPAKPSMGLGEALAVMGFIFGGLTLLIFAAVYGWFGVLLGLGLIAWAVVAHQKGQRSLLSFVFRAKRGLLMSSGLVALGLLYSTCGATGVMRDREKAKAEEKRVAAEAAAAEQRANEQAARVAAVPDQIKKWQADIEKAKTTAKNGDPKKAFVDATAVLTDMEKTRLALGADRVAELESAEVRGVADAKVLKEFADVVTACETVESKVKTGKELAKDRSYVRADDIYLDAEGALATVLHATDAAKAYIPEGFNPKRKEAEIHQLRRAIAGGVAVERKKLEKEAEERRKQEKYVAACGEAPQISPWDGEVVGLESVLARSAHDPDSIDVETCTRPIMTKKICWLFKCDVRGKNVFGAKVLEVKTFSYSRALGFQEIDE